MTQVSEQNNNPVSWRKIQGRFPTDRFSEGQPRALADLVRQELFRLHQETHREEAAPRVLCRAAVGRRAQDDVRRRGRLRGGGEGHLPADEAPQVAAQLQAARRAPAQGLPPPRAAGMRQDPPREFVSCLSFSIQCTDLVRSLATES